MQLYVAAQNCTGNEGIPPVQEHALAIATAHLPLSDRVCSRTLPATHGACAQLLIRCCPRRAAPYVPNTCTSPLKHLRHGWHESLRRTHKQDLRRKLSFTGCPSALLFVCYKLKTRFANGRGLSGYNGFCQLVSMCVPQQVYVLSADVLS